jgi:hypothetical protein
MISASKLCCPVCSVTLALSSGGEIPFRGSHSTIYPVELPEWLPYEFVEEMTKRFQKHLREEIEIMLDGATTKQPAARQRNRGHVPQESVSSITSSNASSTHPDEPDLDKMENNKY